MSSSILSAHQSCIILQDQEAISATFKHLRRRGALSFVYTDVFADHAAYSRSLQQWYPALGPGGVLAGSRYHVAASVPAGSGGAGGLPSWRDNRALLGVRSAVDACALDWAVPVFATYLDMTQRSGVPGVQAMFAQPAETETAPETEAETGTEGVESGEGALHPQFPAWYVFSNVRHGSISPNG
jgi:hypothetical protein